jgi:hypothetical protein
MTDFEIVRVEWVDSVGAAGWVDTSEALRDAETDDLRHISVGFLIDDGDRYVLLALSSKPDGTKVGDVMQIPRVAVLAIERLAVSKRKQPT